jgi:hypothetical protein
MFNQGHDCVFLKKNDPKLPELKVYETRLGPVQKISTLSDERGWEETRYYYHGEGVSAVRSVWSCRARSPLQNGTFWRSSDASWGSRRGYSQKSFIMTICHFTWSKSIKVHTISTCQMVTCVNIFRSHSEFVLLLFLKAHRETDRFLEPSGVQLAQPTSGLFYFRHEVFSSQIKSNVDNTLVKVAPLRFNLNLDGTPITSRTHTHPSHSQTSRLLTSSLSLGVPVPRPIQCIWVV